MPSPTCTLPSRCRVIMNKYDKIDADMLGKINPSSRVYEEYNQEDRSCETNQFAKWIRRSSRSRPGSRLPVTADVAIQT